MNCTQIGIVTVHGVMQQNPCEHLEAPAGNLFKRILPIVSLIFVLAGCSKADDCLTKVEPWSAPNETRTNLGQCWTHDDIIRYYTTSIGTQMVPYKLVLPLKLAVTDKTDPNKLVITNEPFFTKPHIEERWRFLALEPSDRDEQSNVEEKDVAEGWPVGFVVDKRTSGKREWQGEWLGLTCAACHTGQIQYKDQNGKDWKIRIAGGPTMGDINLFLQDLVNSLTVLHEDGVKGGVEFAEYVDKYAKRFGPVDQKDLLSALKVVAAERTAWLQRNTPPTPPGPAGYARLDAFGISYNEIIETIGKTPVGTPRTDAPTSYPFLWDFSHHNQTQWNGAAPAIPIAINIAGALGIFAKYDPDAGWFEDPSTVRLRKLREVQGLLDRLRSPKWPENILGPIDQKMAAAGEKLFRDKCLICHAIQERDKPLKHIKMAMIDIEANTIIDGTVAMPIQTDSNMAQNASRRELTDRAGNEKAKVATALRDAMLDIVLSSSHPWEILYLLKEGLSAFVIWRSDVMPKEMEGYKGRPLDGIWATAPYLHNGSVPNLYELLLPHAKRSRQFCVGSRKLDPKHVGFVMLTEAECKAKDYFWLDTRKEGNHKTGHEGPGYEMKTSDQNGYTDEQIWALVEYMKTL